MSYLHKTCQRPINHMDMPHAYTCTTFVLMYTQVNSEACAHASEVVTSLQSLHGEEHGDCFYFYLAAMGSLPRGARCSIR